MKKNKSGAPQTILYHTRGQVSGSMKTDPINAKTQVKNQFLKDILDQPKQ